MSELTWIFVRAERGPHGELCEWARCAEFPRLVYMQQRARHDAEPVETFHVDGLPNHWLTAEDALRALRANPR